MSPDVEAHFRRWLESGTPDQRQHAAFRLRLAGLDAGAAAPPPPVAAAPAVAPPPRCVYLDDCACHGTRRCLHGTHGPARGTPLADGPATHCLVTPDACRDCPANPAEAPA